MSLHRYVVPSLNRNINKSLWCCGILLCGLGSLFLRVGISLFVSGYDELASAIRLMSTLVDVPSLSIRIGDGRQEISALTDKMR